MRNITAKYSLNIQKKIRLNLSCILFSQDLMDEYLKITEASHRNVQFQGPGLYGVANLPVTIILDKNKRGEDSKIIRIS